MNLPPVDLAEVLRHVRGLAARAEADGRDDEAAWWTAQARRWSIDPTAARRMQLARERTMRLARDMHVLERVDPATVEAFVRLTEGGDDAA